MIGIASFFNSSLRSILFINYPLLDNLYFDKTLSNYYNYSPLNPRDINLTASCKVTTETVPAPNMEAVCRSLGMVPLVTNDGYTPLVYGTQYIAVYFNGRLIGRILLGLSSFNSLMNRSCSSIC